jgi:indole-3-glycerol phosphate synthase
MSLFENLLKEKEMKIESLRGKESLDQLRSRSRPYVLLDIETALMEYGEFQLLCGLSAFVETPEKTPVDMLGLSSDFIASGACCTVLYLDEEIYGTTLKDLENLKKNLEVPIVLRGPIFCEEQVHQAYLHGADGLTLSVSSLTEENLIRLNELTVELGMTSIPEVREPSQIEILRKMDAEIFAVCWSEGPVVYTEEEWISVLSEARRIPKLAVDVNPQADAVRSAVRCGFDGVLLDPSLVGYSNPVATLASLLDLAREEGSR